MNINISNRSPAYIDNVMQTIRKALTLLSSSAPEIKNVPEYRGVMDDLDRIKSIPQNTDTYYKSISGTLDHVLSLLKSLHNLKNHSVMYLSDVEQSEIDELKDYVTEQRRIINGETISETL